MTIKQIDLLNIGLMLISAAAAFVLPFEMFLFSYAVLGPLHYLTEITWLHKRNYFATGKFDYIWLVLLGLLVFFLNFGVTHSPEVSKLANLTLYIAFAAALGFVLFESIVYKILFAFAALVVGFMLSETRGFFLIFAVFLPTLIHVFLFTALFMLYGALKSKSSTGILSVVIVAACSLSFFFFFPHFSFYQVSDYAKAALDKSGFSAVNYFFIQTFNLGTATRETIFASDIGFGVMRFIAFAYTYHYLNWFSKTSVIKWHEVPRNWLITVGVLWVASIALYAYDYYTGLVWLYFLSMAHVFLEFPLNYRSIIGIGEEVGTLVGLRKSALQKIGVKKK